MVALVSPGITGAREPAVRETTRAASRFPARWSKMMPNTPTRFAVAALYGLLLAGAASAETLKPQTGPMVVNPNAVKVLLPRLKCIAAGSPQEFPNDVALTNIGVVPIAAGKKAAWNMPGHGNGVYVFAAPLAPNKSVSLANVLSGGVGAGTPCSVKVL
jgi:hypothetical protein